MVSESIITFYDIATIKDKPLAWNPIVLKARYALNFKGVPYKTVWLEYPDVEPTFRSIGASPTSIKPDGTPHYAAPAIVDPSRRTPSGRPMVISDSWNIAEYLDEAYPTPGQLFPEGTKGLQALFLDHFTKALFRPLAPILVPPLLEFLNEASRPHWRTTGEAFTGAKLEEMCPKGTKKWDDQWGIVQKGLSETAAFLDKNGTEGSYLLMGNKVTFGDFLVASLLEVIFLVYPDDWESKVKRWDNGRWERLRDHCTSWKTMH